MCLCVCVYVCVCDCVCVCVLVFVRLYMQLHRLLVASDSWNRETETFVELKKRP